MEKWKSNHLLITCRWTGALFSMRKAQDQDSGMAKVPPSRGKPQDVELHETLGPTLDSTFGFQVLLPFSWKRTKLPGSRDKTGCKGISIFLPLLLTPLSCLFLLSFTCGSDVLLQQQGEVKQPLMIPLLLPGLWEQQLIDQTSCSLHSAVTEDLPDNRKFMPLVTLAHPPPPPQPENGYSMTSTLTTAAQSGWKCGLSCTPHKAPLYNAAAPTGVGSVQTLQVKILIDFTDTGTTDGVYMYLRQQKSQD